jgi:hypothetical protein
MCNVRNRHVNAIKLTHGAGLAKHRLVRMIALCLANNTRQQVVMSHKCWLLQQPRFAAEEPQMMLQLDNCPPAM